MSSAHRLAGLPAAPSGPTTNRDGMKSNNTMYTVRTLTESTYGLMPPNGSWFSGRVAVREWISHRPADQVHHVKTVACGRQRRPARRSPRWGHLILVRPSPIPTPSPESHCWTSTAPAPSWRHQRQPVDPPCHVDGLGWSGVDRARATRKAVAKSPRAAKARPGPKLV